VPSPSLPESLLLHQKARAAEMPATPGRCAHRRPRACFCGAHVETGGGGMSARPGEPARPLETPVLAGGRRWNASVGPSPTCRRQPCGMFRERLRAWHTGARNKTPIRVLVQRRRQRPPRVQVRAECPSAQAVSARVVGMPVSVVGVATPRVCQPCCRWCGRAQRGQTGRRRVEGTAIRTENWTRPVRRLRVVFTFEREAGAPAGTVPSGVVPPSAALRC